MGFFKILLIGLCVVSCSLSGILLTELAHASNEERFFSKKVEILSAQESQLRATLQLKQDYMRKMICDSRVVDQVIREKTGLSKANEVIFKFDD